MMMFKFSILRFSYDIHVSDDFDILRTFSTLRIFESAFIEEKLYLLLLDPRNNVLNLTGKQF